MSIFDQAKLAEVASQIRDVATARACLGRASTILSNGYVQLEDVTGFAGADDAARGYLDQSRAYAERIYAGLPTDDGRQRDALTAKQQLQVAEALRGAQNALDAVTEATGVEFDFVAGLMEVVRAVGGAAGNVANQAAQSLLVLIWSFVRGAWWVLLLVAVAVYVVRRGLLRAAAGAVT